MSSVDFWVIATAMLVGVSCSLVGVFLVLRQQSMLADAISHSVLLGIVLGLLFFSAIGGWVSFVGAVLVGLLTAFLSEFLRTKAELHADASIGVTFTFLFALGVILVSAFARDVHFDTDCILFGEILFVPLERLILFGQDIGPRSFWSLFIVLCINIALITIGGRALKVISFDPILAQVQGTRIHFWHYTLMAAVSLSVVASFEAVGVILVVAMLVIPASCGFLLARSVSSMIYLAIIFSLLSSIIGYQFATYTNGPVAAAIAMAAGVILLFCIVLSKLPVLISRNLKL